MKSLRIHRCGMLATLTLLLLATGARSFAASVVLDDYSTDKSSHYDLVGTAPTSGSDYYMNAGQYLDPANVPGESYFFVWKDNQLMPGDSASVDVALEAGNTYVGLAVDTSLPSSLDNSFNNYFLVLYNNSAGSLYSYIRDSGNPISGSAPGNVFATLTITRGTGANQDQIAWSIGAPYAAPGNSGVASIPGLTAGQGLYFGPYGFNGTGISNNVGQFDNLTFTSAATAVPTPAALPAGFGLIGLAAMRRRRRR